MKKGILTLMMYLMPLRGQLCLHSSANEDDAGNTTVFFGLSGTGKTTLSADPRRMLIGDDEHVWTDEGIFNVSAFCLRANQSVPRCAPPPATHLPSAPTAFCDPLRIGIECIKRCKRNVCISLAIARREDARGCEHVCD